MSPRVDHLNFGLSQSNIEPAFQPLIDINRSATVGFEVLARWQCSQLGAVNPSVFIKLAEEGGLINALTEQVLTKACSKLKSLSPDPFIAVNISPVQFRDETIIDLICSIVSAHGLPSSRVHIELTESALIEDESKAFRIARGFKERGFGLALDDFGTGYSSLTRLHALPFDKIKIDARFVRRMEVDAASRKIVASVIDLGQSLGMAVVAEGVETAAQLSMLRQMGCDIGQGFYLGRPSTEEIVFCDAYPPGKITIKPLAAPRREKLFQLEAIYRNSPNALAFLDRKGRIIRVNDRFAQIAESPKSDLEGSDVSSLFDAGRSVLISRILAHLIKGRDIRQLEVSVRHTKKTFIVSCTRVVDDDSDLIGISLSLIDVTRRKNAEAVLRADEEHFRRAASARLHLIWAARPTGEVYYMGPTLAAGSHVAVENRILDWYDRMNPEDKVRVRQEWLAWLPSRQSFRTQFRILDQTGGWRLVTSSAEPHFNADGSVKDWLGVIIGAEHI